jgi:hypothetical protein
MFGVAAATAAAEDRFIVQVARELHANFRFYYSPIGYETSISLQH